MPRLRHGLLRERANLLSFVTRALDAIAVVLAGWVAYCIRMGQWALPQRYQLALLLGGLITLVVFPVLGIYHSWRGQRILSQTQRVGAAWLAVAVMLIVLGTATKTSAYFSRQWMILWFVMGYAYLVSSRAGLTVFLRGMRKRGWNHRKIIIVGTGQLASDVARHIDEATWTGLEITAFFTQEAPQTADRFQNVPLVSLSEISSYVDTHQIDEVWFALPVGSEGCTRDVLHDLRHSTVAVRYVPDIQGFHLLNPAISEIAGMAVLDLNVTPMRGINRMAKAIEDRLLAVLALLFFSPFMVLIAVGVKLSSPGPVFYRQVRLGWNGKPFEMLKFRSMPVNAEDKTGATWAKKGEQRATRFGSWLRRTSLDELPQFINVLKGDMSIVGPRPERPVFVEKFKDQVPGYMKKHLVKAGLTGWAQINGWRGDTDLAMRIKYDLYYIEHWSLWFDLKIIALTPFRGFMHQNAY